MALSRAFFSQDQKRQILDESATQELFKGFLMQLSIFIKLAHLKLQQSILDIKVAKSTVQLISTKMQII